MEKMYNLVELFSGIGSQAKALRNIGQKIKTVGTSEWDIHAIIAYDLIHNSADIPDDVQQMSKEQLLDVLRDYTFSNSGKTALDYDSFRTYSHETLKRLYTAIRRNHNYVDISALSGSMLPDNIDILTYSFPCQDLSNVGAFHGYNKGIDKDSGSRSSLLWQVGRILSEMKSCNKNLPRFLLMENVPTLLSQRHFPNFSIWINDLKKLGYISKYYQLNASSFGLPQNRPRLLMISVYVGDNSGEAELILNYFKEKDENAVINNYGKSPYFHQYSVQDLLRTDYKNPKIFNEAVECTPNDTISRKAIWEENPQIVLPGYEYNKDISVIRTITTKQDRNPNSGNLYFDSGIEGRSHFRYLTPRECLLFMGFTDADYRSLKNNNLEFHKGDALFARDKVIRMAGNSIPVKLLEGIFLQIVQIDDLLKEFRNHANLLGQTDNLQDMTEAIKSAMFSRGIRSRLSGVYPDNAQIVYPKYKTAVFLQKCFWDGHNCIGNRIPETNRDFWEKQITASNTRNNSHYSEATSMGWNAIVIWECALSPLGTDMIYDKLAKLIKRNEKNNTATGEVIYLG